MLLLLLGISLLSGLATSQLDPVRQVNWTMNPGCEDGLKWNCNKPLLIYVRAQGANDTVNLLWSFYSKPSFLLAVTEPEAKLSVDWDKLDNSTKPCVRFDPKPQYSFGLVFDKVIEYSDPMDTANMSLSNLTRTLDPQKFHWSLSSMERDGEDLALQMLGSSKSSGNISLRLSAYGKDGYGILLPHLQHSANASQIEIVLDHLQTKFGDKSRFGVQLLMVDSVSGQGPDQVDEKKSLDDEHTPGVFTIAELLTPNVKEGRPGGYLQWRPVAYTMSERSIEASTATVHYPVRNVSQADVKGSLLHDFFGHRLAHDLVPQALNVSFGVSEDGFYAATNYNDWSFTMGFGQPPKEAFSLLVTLVLAIGLGLPAILLIFGGLFILCKKCCAKQDEPLLN